MLARPIDISNNESILRSTGAEFNRQREIIGKKDRTRELRTTPDCENTTRSSNRRKKSKLIKFSWAEISNVWQIKRAPFGFLKAKNLGITFSNFVHNQRPLFIIIYPSNIPI
jgi:hypothetical protein